MATVVDTLVIKLELDDSGVKKGIAGAKSKLGGLSGSVGGLDKGLGGITKSLGKFLGLAVSAAGFGAMIGKINNTNAGLQLMSYRLGTSAREIKAWGNASMKFGGNLQDTTQTLANLKRGLIDIQAFGVSSITPWLRQLGVDPLSNGKARGVTDVLRDIGKKAQTMNPDEAAWMLSNMGIDEGVANMLISGKTEQALAEQKKLTDVTNNAARVALDQQRAMTDMNQSLERLATVLAVEIAPPVTEIANVLAKFFGGDGSEGVVKKFARGGNMGGDLGQQAAEATKDWWNNSSVFKDWLLKHNKRPTGGGTGGGGGAWNKTKANAASKDFDLHFRAAEEKYGLPPGTLRAMAMTESSMNPNAVSPAGARGLMQFMPDTAKEFNVDPNDPIASIYAAGRKMQGLMKTYNGDLDAALLGYNTGEGNIAKGNIGPEGREYAGKVREEMMRGGVPGAAASSQMPSMKPNNPQAGNSSSEVNINNINVSVPGGDSREIAANIGAAVKGNFLVNMSDMGYA